MLHGASGTMQALQSRGFTTEQSREFVSQLVDSQGTAVSTAQLFSLAAALFLGSAIIWLAPNRSTRSQWILRIKSGRRVKPRLEA